MSYHCNNSLNYLTAKIQIIIKTPTKKCIKTTKTPTKKCISITKTPTKKCIYTAFLPVTYSYMMLFLYSFSSSIFCCMIATRLSISVHLLSR